MRAASCRSRSGTMLPRSRQMDLVTTDRYCHTFGNAGPTQIADPIGTDQPCNRRAARRTPDIGFRARPSRCWLGGFRDRRIERRSNSLVGAVATRRFVCQGRAAIDVPFRYGTLESRSRLDAVQSCALPTNIFLRFRSVFKIRKHGNGFGSGRNRKLVVESVGFVRFQKI